MDIIVRRKGLIPFDWVFLLAKIKNDPLLFLESVWNVFHCWTTKNSHQRWDDYDDKDDNKEYYDDSRVVIY